MRSPVSGLTMNSGAVAGLRSARHQRRASRRAFDLGKRGGEPQRVAAKLGAAAVGGIFARAADRHLDQHGGERRGDRGKEHADEAERIVAVAAPHSSEEEGEVGEHGDGAGDRRRDRHRQRVAVPDMRQLVADDPGELLAGKLAEDAGRRRDGGVLRVASGREGVRLRIVDHVDLGHRQSGAAGELAHDVVKLRRRALVDLARLVQAKHELVGVPVAEKVHAGGDEEGDEGAGRAADQIADAHEERRQGRKQHSGLQDVHRRNLVPLGFPRPRGVSI